jgi:hypothetical protein
MAKASEWINRPNTICHYKRFSGFSKANCNACNVGAFKMVELLHLFAENGLVVCRAPWSRRFACHAGIPTGIPEERRHGRRRGNLKGRSTHRAQAHFLRRTTLGLFK